MSRVDDTVRFYDLLKNLERRAGGQRKLAYCDGRMDWPSHGVYFFFESGEHRTGSGAGPRVVRVGTHALRAGARNRLWNRLAQHRGTLRPVGGNHRGSIFRLLAGDAMMRAGLIEHLDSWGRGSSAPADVRMSEHSAEIQVSKYIGSMPFLFLPVLDPAGPDSRRGYIERNSIALISSYAPEPIDPPSPQWLGLHSSRERVRRCGLWNNNHVDEEHDPEFLDVFDKLVRNIK